MGLVQLLMLTPLLIAPSFKNANSKEDYKDVLIVSENARGNYTLTGIDSSFSGSELRIYHYDDLIIDEIDDDALTGSNISILGLSNYVTYLSDDLFNNASTVQIINYTGSEDEFDSLNLTYEFDHVYYYALDEGFINYWNTYIRPSEDTNICEISQSTYYSVYSLYVNLSNDDKEVVDAYTDLAGATIKDSMKELSNQFTPSSASNSTEEWNQTGAITIIIVISLIGMTSITVFFLLKTKNIIQ